MNKIPRPGPVSKIGAMPGAAPGGAVQAPAPATSFAEGANQIQLSTYTTQAVSGTQTLYNADRQWARVTLTLTTAGPVQVGEKQDLGPVTAGQGISLQTGVPVVLDVARGNRLFVTSSAVNRITVVVAPYPWLEVITGSVMAIATAMGGAVGRLVSRITGP